jgi:hypothetical protein
MFLSGPLPIVNVDAGEYAKQVFGQGVAESSGTAAKLRTAVTLSADDVQELELLNGGRQIKLTLPEKETNPGAATSKIGKLTNDFPSADAISSDIIALASGGNVVVNFGSINVTTQGVCVTADFSADGKLLRETIRFDFRIRMERVSVGTKEIPKIPGGTLSWGEAPGTREIVVEYK